MAFSFEKFLSDMMGNTDNTKKTNKKNAKTRIDKKKVVTSQNMDDGGRAALQRAKKRAAAIAIIKEDANNTKTDSTSKSKTMKGGPPAKKGTSKSKTMEGGPPSKKGTSKKKVIVTKAQLEKSGLSLRDYMNMLKSKETGRTITRDSRFDKKKKSPSTSNMKNTFSNDVGKSTKVKKKPSKMNPNKANEFASLKKMTNTVKKNKDGKMVIKKNKQGKYVIKKGY